MRQGKLSNEKLKQFILDRITIRNDETVLGAGVGEDCCAINTGDICVVSTDPITAADSKAGALAIHINANDVASAGAVPLAALVTMLIPPQTDESHVDNLVKQLTDTASALNIDIIGGHTEVTDSVRRVVVSVTMIGKPLVHGKVMKTADMRLDDDIVMTKYAGMEGTSIIAEDYADELADVLTASDKKQLEHIHGALSVVKEGLIAAGIDGVSAMHDVTEGGVTGAVIEMCEAAGVGAVIDFSRIPVLDITKKICAHYGLDVYSLISSGSMLISVANGRDLVDVLKSKGVEASVIGRVTKERVLDERGEELRAKGADELYKVLERQG